MNENSVIDDDATGMEGDATILDNDATVRESNTTELEKDNQIVSARADKTSINKGSNLLNTYQVESEPIEGGLGKVWRVHHTSWNTDLAMKQPKANFFQNEKDKENFIHECEAWINLGLHPHIVSCYYVRDIAGIPTIFAEWMDGGGLDCLIGIRKSDGTRERGKLYERGAEERILDIAIQSARGLHYAHEQGLIHKDVKPANLLLTKDGEVKVADFGLAKARALLSTHDKNVSCDATMLSAAGGYSISYCSPEQMNGRALTRRTDIYSWAISVMEMYLGDNPWSNGLIAGKGCTEYFLDAIIAIPDSLKTLLKECLNENEAQRPHDFEIVVERLIQIYKEEIGKNYSREVSKSAADTADSFNNRALSFLDIGKPEEAEKYWKKALALDPYHAECVYNNALHEWRVGRIADMEVIRRIQLCKQAHAGEEQYHNWNLAMIHIERGDVESARQILVDLIDNSNDPKLNQKATLLQLKIKENKSGELLTRYEGEKLIPTANCFSPDGKKIIIGYANLPSPNKIPKNTVFDVFNAETGECIRTIKTEYITSISLLRCSPKNKYVISVCKMFIFKQPVEMHTIIKLWDVETGSLIHNLSGHSGNITDATFSHDGQFVLSCSADGTVKQWSVENGLCYKTFTFWNKEMPPYSVSISQDDKLAVAGSQDGTITVWSIENSIPLKKFNLRKCHEKQINSIQFRPDNQTFISCGQLDSIKVWNIDSGECIRSMLFDKRETNLWSTSMSSDGEKLISYERGSGFDIIRYWNIKTGKNFYTNRYKYGICSFHPFEEKIVIGNCLYRIPFEHTSFTDWALCHIKSTKVLLNNESRYMATVNRAEKALDVYDISNAVDALNEASGISGFYGTPEYLSLNEKIGRYCKIAGLSSYELIRELPEGIRISGVNPIRFDGKMYLRNKTFPKKTVYLEDSKNGTVIRKFVGKLEGKIERFCFSTDGEYILSWTRGDKGRGEANLWQTKTGKILFSKMTGKSSHLEFSPDSYYFRIDNKVYKTTTKEEIEEIPNYGSMQFSNIKKDTLIFKQNSTVKDQHDEFIIWNMKRNECLDRKKINIHSNVFIISSDDCFALFQSRYSFLLWDIHNEKLINQFSMESYFPKYDNPNISSGLPRCMAVSSNGHFAIIQTNKRSELMLWNTIKGELLHIFIEPKETVETVCFSEDDKYLIALTKRNYMGSSSILFWRLDWKYEFPGWVDWDDRALSFLEKFLSINPNYSENEFNTLISELQRKGYGWIRSEGIKKKLLELCEEKKQKDFVETNKKNFVLDEIKRAEHALNINDIAQAINIVQTTGCENTGFENEFILERNYLLNPLRSKLERFCRQKKLKSISKHTAFNYFLEEHNLKQMLYSPNGENAICQFLSADKKPINTFGVVEIAKNNLLSTFNTSIKVNKIFCLSLDCSLLLGSTEDHSLVIIDTVSGKYRLLIGHTKEIQTAAFSPDTKNIVSAGKDNILRLWDVNSCECIRTHEHAPSFGSNVCFTPCCTQYCYNSEGDNTSFSFWDVKSGKCRYTFKSSLKRKAGGAPTICRFIGISSNNQYALSTFSLYGMIEIWDLNNLSSKLKRLGNKIASLCTFSLDSNFILVSGSENTKIFETETGQLVEQIPKTFYAISPNFKFGKSDIHCMLDWQYEFPGWADWDEEARPYLEIFLARYPNYSDDDFRDLISDLQIKGFGWLRSEGVKRKLAEMTQEKSK